MQAHFLDPPQKNNQNYGSEDDFSPGKHFCQIHKAAHV